SSGWGRRTMRSSRRCATCASTASTSSRSASTCSRAPSTPGSTAGCIRMSSAGSESRARNWGSARSSRDHWSARATAPTSSGTRPRPAAARSRTDLLLRRRPSGPHNPRPMSLAVQVVFTGLSAGGVYGLIAIGHSLIYRLTGIVHFGLGDLIAFGAFITLFVAAGTQPLTQETVSGGRMALAIVAGVVACVVVGAAGYFAVVQPYIGRSAIGWVAATLALGFAIHAVLDAAFSRPAYVFPDPIPFRRVG